MTFDNRKKAKSTLRYFHKKIKFYLIYFLLKLSYENHKLKDKLTKFQHRNNF